MAQNNENMSLRLINLLRGWPSPTLLPTRILANAATSILSSPTTSIPALQYAPDEGPLALRKALSSFLSSFFKRPVSADRICTTGGASQNLGVTLAAFTDPAYTRAVWAVEPTYFLACRIFADAGVTVRGVPDGERGVDVDVLRKQMEEAERESSVDRPKYKHLPRSWPTKIYKHIIYVIPSFSNPTGRCMTLSARQDLVRLARTFDALIVCDDVYDFLYWPTTSTSAPFQAIIPRLVDIDADIDGGTNRPGADGFGNVLSNGSFSKIAGPGVRTGWAEGTPSLAYALSQAGTNRSGGAASNLTGEMVGQALSTGELQKHIEGVLIPAYQRRWISTVREIGEVLEPLGVRVPFAEVKGKEIFDVGEEFKGGDGDSVSGGFFVYLKLPGGVSADGLARRAMDEENLVLAPESMCRMPKDDGKPDPGGDEYIRICFAWVDEGDLVEGIRRFGKVLERMKAMTGEEEYVSKQTSSRNQFS